MGASENHQTTATEHQNVTDRTSERNIDQTLGRFPELTPVHRVFPDPIPGAGDITLHSEWTSSSTASIRSRANGEVTSDGEATVLAMTDGLETSEASMSVGSAEADATGLLKGFGKFSFGAEGVDGGVEFAKLVFALSEACDVGCEPPIPQVVRCFS